MKGPAAAAAALAVVLSACASSTGTLPSPSVAPPRIVTPRPGSSSAVTINYPDPGGQEPGSDILLSVTVTGFAIRDLHEKSPKKDEGHLVYYLDVDEIPTAPGTDALEVGEGAAEASSATSHTWSRVDPGEHKLGVQLVDNDITPLSPPATDEIRMIVTR